MSVTRDQRRHRIGVAIAVHNSWGVLEPCLKALSKSDVDADLQVVVFDDGSNDGTRQHLAEDFPEVEVIRGDGNFWWTGGTNRAVERCLMTGCDDVVLLNPDVFVQPDAIRHLLTTSQSEQGAVCAALVVDREDHDRITWAGSSWGPVLPGVPIWTNRYLYPRGASVTTAPDAPYPTQEVHGRCVLFPSEVLKRFGLHDDLTLPHYSADTDYSRHIAEGGVSMLVVPAARVSLDTTTTGLGAAPKYRERSPLAGAAKRYWRQLTDRKSGEFLHTTWTLSKRYVPWYGVLPTMAFGLGLTTVRFWQREAMRAKAARDDGKRT